jgi:cytochrome c553
VNVWGTWAVRVVGGLTAVALVLLLGMASGVVRLRASAGHWAVTEALLAFAMDRSIATNSMLVEVPDLSDEVDEALPLAVGHYDQWCSTCHGEPGAWHPAFARHMVPPPPPLDAIDDPQQMFWVTLHGLKFSGMPGWTTQVREDEVWVMVALLSTFDELDRAGYRALVERRAGDEDLVRSPPDVVVDVCARCHGLDGEARSGGRVPRLAGQHLLYLEASLEAYAELDRASGFMAPVADALTAEARAEAAAYYARLPDLGPSPAGTVAEGSLVARGREVASAGIRSDRVPACAQCHGPRSLAQVPDNPRYPDLAGQHPAYLRTQLELFRRGVRGGTPFHVLMEEVAGHDLDDETIEAVAAFYGSL